MSIFVLSSAYSIEGFLPKDGRPRARSATNDLYRHVNIFELSRRRRRRSSDFQLHENERNLHSPKNIRPAKLFQASLISSFVAATILLVPMEAQAGFGPSGGATTTPAPGVNKVNVQDLSSKKFQQLIDTSLDESRLNDFRSQLDTIIENLAASLSPTTEEEVVSETSSEDGGENVITKAVKSTAPKLGPGEEAKLEEARSYQEQILNRERLLDKLESQPWWFNYFAAFCGSVASTLVMHPVDTIKTRLQVMKSNSTDGEESGTFSNLYEGLTGNILKEGPPSALYLGVYETMKGSLLHGKLAPVWLSLLAGGKDIQDVNTGTAYLLSIYLAAGAVGELLGSTIRAPAEAMKSLVQSQSVSTTGAAFSTVFMTREGRENVLRAWSSSALRDIPFGAIQLALFELIKAFILNNPNIDFDSSTLQSEAIIGAFAGGVGSFVTNPMDVITTRIIIQDTAGDDSVGVFDMGRRIFEEGGPTAFFAGWQARVLYWAPAISLFLTCYCSVRQLGVKFDLFG